jgi:apolipoprotein N-acyltransferase
MQLRKVYRAGSFLVPVITGILLFFSFPRANQAWLAWISLVPLLLFLARAKNLGIAFIGSLIAFWVQDFLLLSWIPSVLIHYGGISITLAWFLFILLAIYLALFPAFACLVTCYCMQRKGNVFLLIFPFALLLMEYAVSHFLFDGFPWLLLGYSQSSFPLVMQAADLAGVYGISLLVACVNASLAWYFLQRSQKFVCWPALAASSLVLGCLWYGMIAGRAWEGVAANHTVAMLQGNLSADDPQDELLLKYKDRYNEMVRQLSMGNEELLILPESPTPALYESNPSYRDSMHQLASEFPMGMVFNNIAAVAGSGGKKYFNSAYFLNRNGSALQRYDKIHLVPFGEYVPYQSLFAFAGVITRDVGAFSAGSQLITPAIGRHPVNALICFEAVFPDLARRFVRQGSSLIINLTNDAWYGNSAAPYQHLAIARWRAVENRRFLLRAANSGISAVITPTGAVKSATHLFEKGTCSGRFAFLDKQSLYTRFGNFLLIPCAIIVVWAIAYVSLKKEKRSSNRIIFLGRSQC